VDEQQSRKLAVILHADVVGSTSLVRRNETLAHERIHNALRLLSECVVHDGGVAHEVRGDALVAEFSRASDAVCASLRFQQANAKQNSKLADGVVPEIRVGIALGEEIFADDTVTGSGVVLAQRVEQLSEPGGVCITAAIHEAIPPRLPFVQENLGVKEVKGFEEPIQVYRVVLKPGEVVPEAEAGISGGSTPKTRYAVVSAAGLALVVAGVAALWLKPGSQQPRPAPVERSAFPLPNKPSIAVLPFTSRSADQEDEYFADGITDDLITTLSKVSGLYVIARNSAFTYKGKPVKVQRVADELAVGYVLEGSVRRAGNRVRINAQLANARTGHHLWAERYDRDYSDIFSLQDEVIEKIVGAMAVRLTSAEQRNLKRIPTTNLEAYDYYLRAEQQAYASIQTVNVALGLYDEARELDPNFAEAHAGYARAAVHIWRKSYDNFLSNPIARKRAYEAASKALDLNPDLPSAYSVLGFLQLVDGAYHEAIASGRRAVTLGPSSADAYLNLGIILVFAGESAKAVEAVEVARRLDPDMSPRNTVEAGFAYFMDRQPQKAVELLEQARASMPDNYQVIEYLSVAYAKAGRIEEARMAMDSHSEAFPFTGHAYHRIYYDYFADERDLDYYVSALQEAGMPEWPFGFEGRPEDRLTAAEVRELSFGRSWVGTVNRSQPFYQEITSSGAYAYRSGTSFVTGEASMDGDGLCLQSEITHHGARLCGYLYRNVEGLHSLRNEYTYANVFFLMEFSVSR